MLTYTSGTLRSEDQQLLGTFTNMKINAEVISFHAIPGKIEAEDFNLNYGWIIENCTDEGNGFDMGYTDDGDYLDYQVSVSPGGRYKVSYRLASGNSAGGKIDLLKVDAQNGTTWLHSQTVPSTGGWQNWITLSREANLPAGEYTLRLMVNKREFNVNWLNFELLEATGVNNVRKPGDFFMLYPNPVREELLVDFQGKTGNYQLKILNLQGSVIYSGEIEHGDKITLNTGGLKGGTYLLQVSGNGTASCSRFIKID